jgi:hypothetical protein
MTEKNISEKKEDSLFTLSRILFLIVVLFVFSMPLVYRFFSEG